MTISTCNEANFDTKIAVYSGNGCTDFESRLLACNDDSAGCGTTTTITLPVTAGENYTIRLGGFNGATGAGTITLSCAPLCPPCAADFNRDDGVDDLDILAFFTAFEQGDTCGDVNGDDGIDDLDVVFFFDTFAAGC